MIQYRINILQYSRFDNIANYAMLNSRKTFFSLHGTIKSARGEGPSRAWRN